MKTKANAARRKTERPLDKAFIDDLVAANRTLARLNAPAASGHVSVRDPRNPQRNLISRSIAPESVTAADILLLDLDSQTVDPKDDGKLLYRERFIHGEIYKARPDVHAVVHSHSPTVVPFSVTQVPLKAIRAAFLYPEVSLFYTRNTAGWTNLLISNQALGKALAQTLGQNSVALLRGHGNVVVAPTVRIAVYRAIYTEANAKLLLQAKMLGGPITYLAPEEAALMEGDQRRHRPGHGSD